MSDKLNKDDIEDFWLEIGPHSAYSGLECEETAIANGDASPDGARLGFTGAEPGGGWDEGASDLLEDSPDGFEPFGDLAEPGSMDGPTDLENPENPAAARQMLAEYGIWPEEGRAIEWDDVPPIDR